MLMHHSHSNIPNCMPYKHRRISYRVDHDGYSIANPSSTHYRTVLDTNTHPQTQPLQAAQLQDQFSSGRSTAKITTSVVLFLFVRSLSKCYCFVLQLIVQARQRLYPSICTMALISCSDQQVCVPRRVLSCKSYTCKYTCPCQSDGYTCSHIDIFMNSGIHMTVYIERQWC